jgi:hypothetical protein
MVSVLDVALPDGPDPPGADAVVYGVPGTDGRIRIGSAIETLD